MTILLVIVPARDGDDEFGRKHTHPHWRVDPESVHSRREDDPLSFESSNLRILKKKTAFTNV